MTSSIIEFGGNRGEFSNVKRCSDITEQKDVNGCYKTSKRPKTRYNDMGTLITAKLGVKMWGRGARPRHFARLHKKHWK